jgi:hypothetical protein
LPRLSRKAVKPRADNRESTVHELLVLKSVYLVLLRKCRTLRLYLSEAQHSLVWSLIVVHITYHLWLSVLQNELLHYVWYVVNFIDCGVLLLVFNLHRSEKNNKRDEWQNWKLRKLYVWFKEECSYHATELTDWCIKQNVLILST